MGQHQQLYKLWKKTGLIKGKKTPESGRALEARVASFRQKQTIVAMRAYLQMKLPKLITGIIQPLTKRETAQDRAMQTLDGQGHRKGTVSLLSTM